MARDRFLYWQKNHKPTQLEVEMVCKNFLGAAGRVTWNAEQSRFYVRLDGFQSFPLDGIPGVYEKRQALWDEEKKESRPRYVEVYVDNDHIDVMTREQDEFTNCVADGLVAIFQRFWRPSSEPGGTRTPVV